MCVCVCVCACTDAVIKRQRIGKELVWVESATINNSIVSLGVWREIAAMPGSHLVPLTYLPPRIRQSISSLSRRNRS